MEKITAIAKSVTEQPYFKPVLYGTVATLIGLMLYKRYGA